MEADGARFTMICEDKRRQAILNGTLFSLNGTTNLESKGAPITILESQGSSFDSTRYDELGAPMRENAPVGWLCLSFAALKGILQQ